ncbi:MAG: hypothetical protein QOI38_876 [Sphingomonadales bacterium]|jgi:hypothetical protein|nr:hypothetical protein [Sphingomonadales bacterium]
MPFPRPSAAWPALLAAAALATGCKPEGTFPSLAPRPIESEDPLAEPIRTAPAVAADPQLRGTAASLLAEARRGDREFEAAAGAAGSAARGPGSPGSESWVAAQEAISRAEAARAPTMRALAELDRLATERAGLPTNDADFAAIRAALAEAERLAAGQQRRMDRLRGAVMR